MIFQLPPEMDMWMPFIYAGITLGMMVASWIPILKIGLIITKAKVKREWKWVIASALIQAGAVFFIMIPIFLWGFLGTMQEGPDMGLIFGLLATIMLSAATQSINDAYDVEVDIANKRFDRPIARGAFTREYVIMISSSLFILSSLIS